MPWFFIQPDETERTLTQNMELIVDAKIAEGLAKHGLLVANNSRLPMNFNFEAPARLFPGTSISSGSTLRAFSYVSYASTLFQVDIGRYCSIGDGVRILSSHPTTWLTASPIAYQEVFPGGHQPAPHHGFPAIQTTVIGNDVWIGAGTNIKSGIKIGDGAFIGAGAVVTKDVPPFAVMGGVPAKVLRYRFTPELIARIMACPWWDLDLSEFTPDWQQPEVAMDRIAAAVAAGNLLERQAPLLAFYAEIPQDAPDKLRYGVRKA